MDNNADNTGITPSTRQGSGEHNPTPLVLRDERGRLLPGGANINPSGSGGFGDNPDHRSNGSWKKEKTPRAKLEKMFESMTVEEFMVAITAENVDNNLAGKIGDIAASGRLANIFDRDGATGKMKVNSKEFDSLMYFVYGSKSEVDASLKADDGVPIVKGFIIPMSPEDFIDDSGKQKSQ